MGSQENTISVGTLHMATGESSRVLDEIKRMSSGGGKRGFRLQSRVSWVDTHDTTRHNVRKSESIVPSNPGVQEGLLVEFLNAARRQSGGVLGNLGEWSGEIELRG